MAFCWLFCLLWQTHFNQYLPPFRAFYFACVQKITLVEGLGLSLLTNFDMDATYNDESYNTTI